MHLTLPLARTAIDPDATSRTDPGLIGRLVTEPTTRALLVQRGLVASRGDALDLREPGELPPDVWTDTGHVFYLGRDAVHAYVALVLPERLGEERDLDGVPVVEDARLVDLVATLDFRHLRDVGDGFGDRDADLATTAIALAAWHDRHPRCPRCGEPTEVGDAGWIRRCTADGSQHFPRTDPAVIMTVTDASGERLLLGHSAHWPERRFSTLAGYVEPGESVETAVAREVKEEVGLDVAQVEYLGSQPWPFPASLMLGFRAVLAEGQETIAVDGVEITDARFFTRGELAAAVAAEEVLLPMRSSIARALIEDWHGERLPTPGTDRSS